MTTTAESPISIAQSIQADQEPRRFRELRETLAASKQADEQQADNNKNGRRP